MLQASASETRRHVRKPVLRMGILVFPHGQVPTVVTLRDISASGARVTVPQVQDFPQTFHLIDLMGQVAYESALVHRRGRHCGLQFARRLPLAQLPTELRHLSRIWFDFAAR